MLFGGIQKLTLLDFPDKTACTVFTAGCNFNCPYCQNSSLIMCAEDEQPAAINEQAIHPSEILDFLKKRQGLLDGVCISGGEPLIHDDLSSFIESVKELGFLVKLDTNGSYPRKLEKLIASGTLDYVAMDIKNTKAKYAQTIGIPGYDTSPVEESMALLSKNKIPYEFRTTVVREFHTGADLLSIAMQVSGTGRFCLQSFVDSDGVRQSGLHGYCDEEMQQFLHDIAEILPTAELRGM